MPAVRIHIRRLSLLPPLLLMAACQTMPESRPGQSSLSFIPDGFQELFRPQQPDNPTAWSNIYGSADEARVVTRIRLTEQSALFLNPDEARKPDDLWDRLLSGYQLSIPDNARVESELQSYAQSRDYLEQIQQRARPYFHFILEEVEKRDLPAELALLPVIESGFQPFAYSPSHASGLWQFIPSTARRYGLTQDRWYDGRRDVVASTRAALDHLQELNQLFEGDWELALAAYNAGAGSVQRAVEKNRRLGKPTDFWSLDLPRETRNYVPRLLALAKLVSESEDFGIELQAMPNEPYFSSVTVDGQLDLAQVAKMAEVPMEELKQLNAGYNRRATAPNGTNRLQLPVDKVEVFEERLAALGQKDRQGWQPYQVKKGDSLDSLARRYGTTVAELKEINELTDARLRPGRQLLVPTSATAGTDAVADAKAQTQQASASRKPQSPQGTRVVHQVVSGDTLWNLARRYRVAHGDLAQWNGLKPQDTLRLGQELVVWTKEEPLAAAELPTDDATDRNILSYQVRKGDSLAAIAQRFKVSVDELKEWNTLRHHSLQPGQRLTLYVDLTERTL